MRTRTQTSVSLPPEIIPILQASAKKDSRTFSAQILHYIKRGLVNSTAVDLGDVVATLRAAGVDEPTIANVTRGLVGGQS